MEYIYSIRISFQGAYVINGVIGNRSYFYYTKREAIARYKEECKQNSIQLA